MTETADSGAVLERVRALAPSLRERAAAAEASAQLPQESVDELLAAGIARILVPRRFGGYELGLETWLDVVLEIARADASHGWCASLLIHHPHYLAQFSEAAQTAVWADGPDVAIATSLEPRCQVELDGECFVLRGRSPFTSGVMHSSWALLGGMLPGELPEPALFLVDAGSYEIAETWATTAMRGTGSNTVVTDGVRVATDRVLRISDMREGTTPGAALHEGSIYRAPWMSYATLTFAIPILGAASGGLDELRAQLAQRAGTVPLGTQVRLGRAASDLDAAELLLRRAVAVAQDDTPPSLALRARAMRDASRAVELAVGALDTAIALSGSSGFSAGNPLERAWRDAHFAASHIALNADSSLAHWARTALALERPTDQIFY
jgi:3-hydroxy-9,10-secoandrosta-1,3,5(10)-triene-9,17-dione monooxygenase